MNFGHEVSSAQHSSDHLLVQGAGNVFALLPIINANIQDAIVVIRND
jgi:hypothetical protein